MSNSGLNRIRDRIARRLAEAKEYRGPGYKYDVEMAGRRTQSVDIRGVKPTEITDDALVHLFIDVWSLKEYVANRATDCGRPAEWIKEVVHTSEALKLCADLANTEKHEVLTRTPWTSHEGIHLGTPTDTVPGEAVEVIIVDRDYTKLQVKDAERVRREFPIVDGNGRVVGHALPVLESAIERLDEALAVLEGR